MRFCVVPTLTELSQMFSCNTGNWTLFFLYFWFQSVNSIPCPVTAVRALPTLEVKQAERPSSKSRDPPRDEEREKKRKKHKKRSRTRSRSPFKYHSSSKSRSRSHSKAKHSLPTAYRTVRHSRWVWKPNILIRVLCGLTLKSFALLAVYKHLCTHYKGCSHPEDS